MIDISRHLHGIRRILTNQVLHPPGRTEVGRDVPLPAPCVVGAADPDADGRTGTGGQAVGGAGSDDSVTAYHSLDDLPSDTPEGLRLHLLLSGVTKEEVGRHLGVDRSNVSHQLQGRERLQPGVRLAIIRLAGERLSLLARERPWEQRLLVGTGGPIRPVIDYSSAVGVVDPFAFVREFDRMPWFHMRKAIGLLTLGTVAEHNYTGPHIQTAMGDHLNVYTTVIHRANQYYGFKKVRSSEYGLFICRPTAAFDLGDAYLYLVPPSVISELVGEAGDLFIPHSGRTSPDGRWPGRDLHRHSVTIDCLRSLATTRLPDDGPGPAARDLDTAVPTAHGPRWTAAEEALLASLWESEGCSLGLLVAVLAGRSPRAILAHARKVGLRTPRCMPNRRQEWSGAEDRLLLTLAGDPSADAATMSLAFPGRTPSAVNGRLRRLRDRNCPPPSTMGLSSGV